MPIIGHEVPFTHAPTPDAATVVFRNAKPHVNALCPVNPGNTLGRAANAEKSYPHAMPISMGLFPRHQDIRLMLPHDGHALAILKDQKPNTPQKEKIEERTEFDKLCEGSKALRDDKITGLCYCFEGIGAHHDPILFFPCDN